MGLRLMITSFCFSLKDMEQSLITALPWIWVLIIYQTKDTFQEFRTMEWDVYWKHNWGLRVLHWLPSNFYLSEESSTFTFHFHALEKEMATPSSTLAWRIPGMEEPGGLLSMGSHRVGHDWSDLAAAAARNPGYNLGVMGDSSAFMLVYMF